MKSRFLVLSFLVLAACANPSPQARIRISGGERVLVTLVGGRVEGYESKLAKVMLAQLMVSPLKKEAVYQLGMQFAPGVVPVKITVEDVSDDKPVVLLEDEKPELMGPRWMKVTGPVDIEAASMKWLHDIDDSFRVYRFTLTLQDGQKITLLNAAYYMGYFKTNMISALKPATPPAASP